MRPDRSSQACLYYRGFETHTNWGPMNPSEIEIVLKVNALFYQGIIIADSDLNNNVCLQKFTIGRQTGAFTDALQNGFVRRAARTVAGAPISQSDLYEDLKKSNPARVVEIPRDHPRMLDSLLRNAESTYAPLPWSVEDLARIFAERLILELSLATLSSRGRRIADTIIDYVAGFGGTYKDLRGAAIERQFLSKHERNKEQSRIWQGLIRAYNGNVPEAFKGQVILGTMSNDPNDVIPGGVESDPRERDLATDYYLSLMEGTVEDLYAVGIDQISAEGARWYIDIDRLLALSLSDIEKLREEAAPDEYFGLRFKSLGSSAQLSSVTNSLIAARDVYMSRLSQKGKELNLKIVKDRKAAVKRILIEKKLAEEERKDVADGAKVAVSAIPGVGSLVSLGDALSLGRRLHRRRKIRAGKTKFKNEALWDAEFAFEYALKRPDYEVVRQVKERILTGRTSKSKSQTRSLTRASSGHE